MRKIPEQLREELAADPFYKKCCIGTDACEGKIEWHHNLIYAGQQVNEKFCILPICHRHHEYINLFKPVVDKIMLNRATDEELKKYSKGVDYVALKKRLNEREKFSN